MLRVDLLNIDQDVNFNRGTPYKATGMKSLIFYNTGGDVSGPVAGEVWYNHTAGLYKVQVGNKTFTVPHTLFTAEDPATDAKAYALWFDPTTGIFKLRNAGNSAWVELFLAADDETLGTSDAAGKVPLLGGDGFLPAAVIPALSDTVRVLNFYSPADWGPHTDFSTPVVSEMQGFGLFGQTTPANVLYALLDDGGSFTNYTTAANNGTTDDVHMAPALVANDDAFYVGGTDKFSAISFVMTNGADTADSYDVEVEYSTAGGWSSLNFSVGDQYSSGNQIDMYRFRDTSGATVADFSAVFAPPADWAATVVNVNKTAYWIRFRFTNVVTHTETMQATTVTISPLDDGDGITIPFTGDLTYLTYIRTEVAADDIDLLLINVTTGDFATATVLGANLMTPIAVTGLSFTAGDQLVIQSLGSPNNAPDDIYELPGPGNLSLQFTLTA